jgi:diacylglycerol O-acyltransferase
MTGSGSLPGMTARTPQHAAFLGIYDPSSAKGDIVRFKHVLANFERRLHARPHFHTRLVQVPVAWRQLCIQVARLHSRSMDMNHPMWECYVIEGLDPVEGCAAGSFAVHLKVHHALVDGDLGQQIMTAIHNMEPYPPPGSRASGR